MANAQILVVEDEVIVADDIQSKLERLGYEVPAVVASGEEAIEKAAQLRPDLVLMDIVLKGDIDGVETAEQIYQRFNIPVIYLTAYADDDTLQRAKRTEPLGYILKPYALKELHTAIETALYRYPKELRLKERAHQTGAALQYINEAAAAIDQEGLITLMNPMAEALTGWKQEDALGRAWTDVFLIIDDVTGAQADFPLTKALQEGVVVHPENNTKLIRQDGKETPVDASAAPIEDDNGDISGAILVFRDVTEQKQTETKLEQMRAQLEKSEKVRAYKRGTRRLSREDRRRQLLETAIRVVAQKGFGRTTSKEIAAAAGISEPVIFQHFATKEELYAAIIDYKVTQSQFEASAALELAAEKKNDQAVFKILALQILNFYFRESDFIRLLLYGALERHEISMRFIRQQTTPLHKFLVSYINRRIEDGAFRHIDPDATARNFFGMVHNHGLLRVMFKEPTESTAGEDAADRFIDILMRGILVQ